MSSTSVSMNTVSPARAGAAAASGGSTVRVIGEVRSPSTDSAGMPMTPARRGSSATANSERDTVRPLRLSRLRRLLWPLNRKSPRNAS